MDVLTKPLIGARLDHLPVDDAAQPRSGHIGGSPLDRGPPKRIQFLLPIWGARYIRQFLQRGLPTWLADGNLPAVAKMLPTEFVLLTGRDDALLLHYSVQMRKLREICPVRVHYIDHLITNSNYSTTITLAYTEAIRATGDAMLDTCFFFLVSDYIMADRSLSNVVGRMMQGYSGVLVGNFQVAEEDAAPWLVEQLSTALEPGTFTPRELIRWGLSHLHPATIANTVNYPLNHNDHTNRLFWRVDNNTLIGRFYLMHMICIRPEVTDFVIGSSCDYSFIPEMAPSDNVSIITDSDEYLVIDAAARA